MTESPAICHDAAPVLEARGIVKDFPGVRALDGVSFAAKAGAIHALVGENGAGKSTLIKVLSGVHPAGSYAGSVIAEGKTARFRSTRDAERAGIAVIHQELALVESLGVAENIFLGREPRRFGLVDFPAMNLAASRILARLGLDIDPETKVGGLGVGHRQLIEIARALSKDARALILDEPTAALSGNEVEMLQDILLGLRGGGTAIVYISHRLDEVFALADDITALRDGRTVGSRPASAWTRPEIIKAMVGRDVSDMFPRAERSPGETALEVKSLSVRDPGDLRSFIIRDASLSVRSGEILGIYGLMGSGRTELLMSIFGAPPGPAEGEIFVAGKRARIGSPRDAIRLGLALAPEDRKSQGLNMAFSIRENLSLARLGDFTRLGLVDGARERNICSAKARSMGVKARSIEDMVVSLSGGNQQKVVLGKWLIETPRVLLLDEPTRGIDVGAKAEIHRLIGELVSGGMAVIMASSELPEVLGVSDRVLVMKEGRPSGLFERSEASAEAIMEVAT